VHDVTRLEFCRDFPHHGNHARRECDGVTAPRFGCKQENQWRGHWFDVPTLLCVHGEADTKGQVIESSEAVAR